MISKNIVLSIFVHNAKAHQKYREQEVAGSISGSTYTNIHSKDWW